ncbi:hypothetical protein DID75_02070 [Candidatus Marinamargulisbacteria bacterium SCGC AG-410-N11]|nr:hypothetical protein DID75_02070 [Candidatus Marinamargulisbacteria bacterium SCGC AG-410-N11]
MNNNIQMNPEPNRPIKPNVSQSSQSKSSSIEGLNETKQNEQKSVGKQLAAFRLKKKYHFKKTWFRYNELKNNIKNIFGDKRTKQLALHKKYEPIFKKIGLNESDSQTDHITVVLSETDNQESKVAAGFLVNNKFITFNEANQLKNTHCLLAKTLNRMLLALNTGDELKTKKNQLKLGSKLYLKDKSLLIRQGVIFTKKHSIGTISSFEDLKHDILNHIHQSEFTKASEKLIALNKIAQSVPEFRKKLDHFEQNELLGATNVKALDTFLNTAIDQTDLTKDTESLKSNYSKLANKHNLMKSFSEQLRASNITEHRHVIVLPPSSHIPSVLYVSPHEASDYYERAIVYLQDIEREMMNINTEVFNRLSTEAVTHKSTISQIAGFADNDANASNIGNLYNQFLSIKQSFKATNSEIQKLENWTTSAKTAIKKFNQTNTNKDMLFQFKNQLTKPNETLLTGLSSITTQLEDITNTPSPFETKQTDSLTKVSNYRQTLIDNVKHHLLDRLKTIVVDPSVEDLCSEFSSIETTLLGIDLETETLDITPLANWVNTVSQKINTYDSILTKANRLLKYDTIIAQSTELSQLKSNWDAIITKQDGIDSKITDLTQIFNELSATFLKNALDVAKENVDSVSDHIKAAKTKHAGAETDFQIELVQNHKTMLRRFKQIGKNFNAEIIKTDLEGAASRFTSLIDSSIDAGSLNPLKQMGIEAIEQNLSDQIDALSESEGDTPSPLDQIIELFIEKEFGETYTTLKGTQYQVDDHGNWLGGLRDKTIIDKEIDDILKDCISGTGTIQEKKIKLLRSVIYSRISGISSLMKSDSHRFTAINVYKDMWFSRLRSHEIMVEALNNQIETISSETDVSLSSSNDDFDNQLKRVVNLYTFSTNFQVAAPGFIAGLEEDTSSNITFFEETVEQAIQKRQDLDSTHLTFDSESDRTEFKEKCAEFAQLYLLKKKIINQSGDFRPTNKTIQIASRTTGKGDYKNIFNTFFKPDGGKYSRQFNLIKVDFEELLITKQQYALRAGGSVSTVRGVTNQLKSERSAVTTKTTNAHLKWKLFAKGFFHKSLADQKKAIEDIKQTVQDARDAATEDKTELQSDLEERSANLRDKLDQARETIDTLEQNADTIIQNFENASESASTVISEGSEALEESMNQLSSLLTMTSSSSESKSSSPIDLSSFSQNLQQLDTSKLEAFLETSKETLKTTLTSGLDIAEDALDNVDELLSSFPYYNQVEASIKIINDLKNLYQSDKEMKKFKTILTTVDDIRRYCTESDLENDDTLKAKVKERISSMVDYSKNSDKQQDAMISLACNVANLLSPPGFKVGKFVNGVSKLGAIAELEDEDIEQIAENAFVIKDDLANLAGDDFNLPFQSYAENLLNQNFRLAAEQKTDIGSGQRAGMMYHYGQLVDNYCDHLKGTEVVTQELNDLLLNSEEHYFPSSNQPTPTLAPSIPESKTPEQRQVSDESSPASTVITSNTPSDDIISDTLDSKSPSPAPTKGVTTTVGPDTKETSMLSDTFRLNEQGAIRKLDEYINLLASKNRLLRGSSDYQNIKTSLQDISHFLKDNPGLTGTAKEELILKVGRSINQMKEYIANKQSDLLSNHNHTTLDHSNHHYSDTVSKNIQTFSNILNMFNTQFEFNLNLETNYTSNSTLANRLISKQSELRDLFQKIEGSGSSEQQAVQKSITNILKITNAINFQEIPSDLRPNIDTSHLFETAINDCVLALQNYKCKKYTSSHNISSTVTHNLKTFEEILTIFNNNEEKPSSSDDATNSQPSYSLTPNTSRIKPIIDKIKRTPSTSLTTDDLNHLKAHGFETFSTQTSKTTRNSRLLDYYNMVNTSP